MKASIYGKCLLGKLSTTLNFAKTYKSFHKALALEAFLTAIIRLV